MITNPQIGMKVKCTGWYATSNSVLDKVGTIVTLGCGYDAVVEIDGLRLAFSRHELEFVSSADITEQLRIEDQLQREEHADKYL